MAVVVDSTIASRTPGEHEPGTYLTDGRRLFRVVRGFAWPPHASEAILEDCRTLEEGAYPPDELARMGLRVVQPAGAAR